MADEANIGEMWIEFVESADLNKMQASLKQHTAEVKKLDAYFGKIAASVKRMALAYATYEVLNQTIVKAVSKASEREQQLLRLEAVLIAHNVKGKEINKLYQEMAKAISNTTKYTTGQALAAEEVLTTMGVAPNLMEDALQAATQLASRTGSLESAAQLIGQAMEGNMKSIGKVVIALRGVKNVSPETVFKTINETYGSISKDEIEGYIGQKQKLKKEYDAILLVIGKFVTPILTEAIKYFRKNPKILASILATPAIGPWNLLTQIIKSFDVPQWEGSVGYQRSSNVLAEADKNFQKPTIEKQAKQTLDLQSEWIKAIAEQYAAAEEANEKWWEEQRKLAEQIAKQEYDLNMANSEAQRNAEKENMIMSWKIKQARLSNLNDLENRALRARYSMLFDAIGQMQSLQSYAGSSLAITGVERIIEAEKNIYSSKLELARRRYDALVEAYRAGLVSNTQLDIAGQKVFALQIKDQLEMQLEIVGGTLDALAGLSQMFADAADNDSAFYVYQAIAIASTIVSTVGAAKKAYDIGEDIPYAGEYLKWIFMAIAIAVGMARVAAITSTHPGSVATATTPEQNYNTDDIVDAVQEENIRHWNPTVKWVVYDSYNGVTNKQFAREMLPYIVGAQNDQVH